MYTKNQRHAKILEIIENNNIENQEELVRRLHDSGFNVTQATVSRDIHNLRLIKATIDNGVQIYTQTAQTADDKSNEKLRGIFAHSVTNVTSAGNMIVVKTLSGAAQAAASAIDSFGMKEIIGSIAGDDTIMIVANNAEDADYICHKLNELRG